MWQPNLLDLDGPLYEKIAAALERDIRAGLLENGTRLPTLKELAVVLGVTPGTVSRAYELAQRRGLVGGEVGRGTFVRDGAAPLSQAPAPAAKVASAPAAAGAMAATHGALFDLSIIKPNMALQEPYARAALLELSQAPILSDMLDYTPDGAHLAHREAGAWWLRQAGLDACADQIVLTAGAQHGLLVAVSALTRPGDLVLCESLCYPGIASVVHSLGRRLKGVGLDGEGMDPRRLRAQCQEERPAMTICIATCQNPTSTVMSAARRQAIADIAREFDFILVDDDLYGFLAPTPVPPLASFAPERSLYLTSLSKSVLSTVRMGYLHGPAAWLARLAASVRSSIWMVSPLAAQLATHLINSGKATELSQLQREEARARQQLARELLGQFEYRALATGFHVWLKLPPSWDSGEQFAALALGHQLRVAGGDAFSMNRDGEGRQWIRITLMAGSREQMRFVLSKLAGLLDSAQTSWL